MTEEKLDIFSHFHNISSKLKKKRILKKPNVSEASQQFENLGLICERENLPQYAGLSYQAAAKCQNSLGNTWDEGFLLLKSSRLFMDSYFKHFNDKLVANEVYLHHSFCLYKEFLTRFENIKEQSKFVTEVVTGETILEVADSLKFNVKNIEEASSEYERALGYFSKSPVELIYCLQKIVSSKIESGDYIKSLEFLNKITEEAKSLPLTGIRETTLVNSEITQTFLLLILQPTSQQISPAVASALEKYAWVETCNNNEMIHLNKILGDKDLSMLNEDLFLKLQSLVMACQYNDFEGLRVLESDLMPHLNKEQRMLLKILVRQYGA